MKKLFLSAICICLFALGQAQINQNLKISLDWTEGYRIHRSESVFAEKSLHFDGATYHSSTKGLPIWTTRIKLNGPSQVRAQLVGENMETFDPGFSDPVFEELEKEVRLEVNVGKERENYYAFITLIPISKNANNYQRLKDFEIKFSALPKFVGSKRSNQPTISELATGDLYKISVSTGGIFKLDANFFTETLGLSLSDINVSKIKLLATEGGPLRKRAGDNRQLDLLDYPLFFNGNTDSNFDQNEFFLFHTDGPNRVEYNTSENLLRRKTNQFSFVKHFIIKIGSEDGARMTSQDGLNQGDIEISSFNTSDRFEEDKFNVLFQEDQAQGTGQEFYGDLFNQIREQDFSFNFPNIIPGSDIQVKSRMILRGATGSRFMMNVEGEDYTSPNAASISIGNADRIFADAEIINATLENRGSEVNVNISYPAVGDGTNKAWLDYIEVNAERALNMTGTSMVFQNFESQNYASATFKLNNASASIKIWDITNWDQPILQNATLNGNTLSWSTSTEGVLKKYIAYNENADFPTPEFTSTIENQNIHGIENTDMVIIYHPNFKSQAERLAAHRAEYNDIKIELVSIGSVWNEFSGGSIDPSAIRDFMKMIYERSPEFKTLLLFGDGSFDYRDIYNAGGNFIPTYQTEQSLDPILAYPTDDYFALLDDDEGEIVQNGLLDLGVGRIPCKTLEEAKGVVDKIIHYETSVKTLNDWRNRSIYLSDDEDTNLHFNSSEKLTDKAEDKYEQVNQVKVHLDAFEQEATSGGQRFPLAQEALNRNIFRGALILNYFGHGGSQGWAQERVITLKDITSWNNLDNLPLFITATCSFTGFDEPGLVTGGEMTILNPKGGAIALMSTTRAVFAQDNERMVLNLFDSLIVKRYSMGEMLRVAKNKLGVNRLENLRKFSVFGDPSMHLAVPEMQVVTTKINGKDVSNSGTGFLDTLSALETVTIEGQVLREDGSLNTEFNGRVYPTIFDKKRTASTLGQDERSLIANFIIQNSVVFKGQASVNNGLFTFSFIVPKDIDYNIGEAKISYYAEDGTQIDAGGIQEGFAVGGGANADLGDDSPPIVDVHMNEIPFPNGGTTDENPVLIADLSDDFGINIAGQAVGHNLTAVLDGNTAESFLLNDFYEAALDDYTSGQVRFPLFNISPGKHIIEVKAWDVSNNSGVGSIEFFVAESGKIALNQVLNYPNPFTTNTSFQFEHNMNGNELDVQVQVFTVSGKLVKTIQERVLPEGSLVRDISWDGTDDYGDQLSKGVYVYRVKVRNVDSPENQAAVSSDYEKLVILK